MTIEPLQIVAANVSTTFFAKYLIQNGQVFRRAKNGSKNGKSVEILQILAFLAENNVEFGALSLSDKEAVVHILMQDRKEELPDMDDVTIDEVDPWIVPLMKAFLWHSDGKSIQGFFWPAYAQAVSEGMDPAEAEKECSRELVLISDPEGKGIATALAAYHEIWKSYDAAYNQAILHTALKVTPKAVKDGRKFYHSFRSYLTQMAPAWSSDIRFAINQMPATLTNNSATWAFWQFTGDTLPDEYEGKYPTWETWMRKIVGQKGHEVFMAWVASIFDAKNTGRQLMWIEDNGGGGKGTITRVLSDFIGKNGCGSISKHTFESEFGAESVYGKRLLIHPDNTNPRLLSTALVHQITGGDDILVNRKFEKPITVRIQAKLLIMANCPPESDIYNFHERSRLIYLRLDPNREGADRSHLVVSGSGVQLKGDPGFETRLSEELPAFLQACLVMYQEYCPSRSNIILPQDTVDSVETACISHEQQEFEDFFRDNFVWDPEGKFPAGDLHKVFETFHSKKGNLGFGSFRKFLATKGIRPARNATSRYYAGIRAKTGDDE